MYGKIFCKIKDLVIQLKAVKTKISETIFSSLFIGPISNKSLLISSFPPGNSFCLNLNADLVRYNHATASNGIAMGNPNLNHCKKVISMP